jgi:hypothetical protein
MGDRVTTWRVLPEGRYDASVARLAGCEDCAYVWDQGDRCDIVEPHCPLCGGWNAGPLYCPTGESNNTDWSAPSEDLSSLDEARVLHMRSRVPAPSRGGGKR